ncbi:MAG: hypothetical protein ABIQ51_21090 [Mesorhizobium sp.]
MFTQIAVAQEPGFASSLLGKPSDWAGSEKDLFAANYAFPAQAADMSTQPWMTLNPSVDAERDGYLSAILAYGLSSFVGDIRSGCPRVSQDWYHVPWLTLSFGNTQADIAAGKIGSGREPICGLTQERPAPVGFLHKKQMRKVQTWAVGTFNEPGGFLLGKVWKDRTRADLSDLKFPNGAFVVKFLFTEADTTEVPYLLGSPEWKANVYSADGAQSRSTKTMRLIQIDFGVRDARFETTTGWVFGTFIYYNGDTAAPVDWKTKLVPVGVMWGNDHGKMISTTFTEQVLNPTVAALATGGKLFDLSKRQTFGWSGRVNGILDNPVSSCLSCHGTAQVHKTENIKQFILPALLPGQVSDANKMLWFRNTPAGTPFVFTAAELALVKQDTPSLLRADWTPALMADFVSTDYSLQLRMAIENERFFNGLQQAVDVLEKMSKQLKEPVLATSARTKLLEAFRRESKVIARSGEPE